MSAAAPLSEATNVPVVSEMQTKPEAGTAVAEPSLKKAKQGAYFENKGAESRNPRHRAPAAYLVTNSNVIFTKITITV